MLFDLKDLFFLKDKFFLVYRLYVIDLDRMKGIYFGEEEFRGFDKYKVIFF